MTRPAGVKLVSHHGHSHWADPTLRDVDGGYALGVACDLGGRAMVHWLVPDPARPGRFTFADAPHAWATTLEASEALEAYRGQQE